MDRGKTLEAIKPGITEVNRWREWWVCTEDIKISEVFFQERNSFQPVYSITLRIIEWNLNFTFQICLTPFHQRSIAVTFTVSPGPYFYSIPLRDSTSDFANPRLSTAHQRVGVHLTSVPGSAPGPQLPCCRLHHHVIWLSWALLPPLPPTFYRVPQ